MRVFQRQLFRVPVVALLYVCLGAAGPCVLAATNEVSVLKDLAYKPTAGLSDHEQQRCKLDLYLPQGQTGFATLVWFHGGALKEGSKDDSFNGRIAQHLAHAGLAVAMANYRLSPKAKYPSYVEDAAAAFAWTHGHIADHGGDPKRVFVGGHSAGAYLALMIGLERHYLGQHGLDPRVIAGLIPVSGQTMTHYTIRDERGLPHNTILADTAAPIHHVRKDAPPMLVLYADNDLPARAEENQYLVAALKAAGATQVAGQMIRDRDHGSVAGNMAQPGDPAAEALLCFIGSATNQPASLPANTTGNVFDEVASKALAVMKTRAKELQIQGVAVVAYAEGGNITSWSSKMAIVGSLKTAPSEKDPGANLLAIAYAKAAEMANTLKASGSEVRPLLKGEFGWQGGLVKQGKTGYLIAAFSGGKSEDDVKVSQAGLAVLDAAL